MQKHCPNASVMMLMTQPTSMRLKDLMDHDGTGLHQPSDDDGRTLICAKAFAGEYWPKISSRTYMENVLGSSLYCLMMVQMNHMSYLQYDMSRRLNVFEFTLNILPETVLAYGVFDGSFELELIRYCSRGDDAPVS